MLRNTRWPIVGAILVGFFFSTAAHLVAEQLSLSTMVAAAPSGTLFGTWKTKSVDVIYQAETDGFVVAIATIDSSNSIAASITGFTGTSSDPTTIRGMASVNAVAGEDYPISSNTFTMPIKKGENYKVTRTSLSGGLLSGVNLPLVNIFWIPLET